MTTAHLRERETAEYLNVGAGTLRKWRREGRGPAWTRIEGGRIRYPVERLREWIELRTREPKGAL
jgi:excisionase family DNA binding protein